MPEIVEKYQFGQINPEGLYQDGLNALKELGAQELNVQDKTVMGMVPSIWGWGGMKVGFKVYQEENITKLDLSGYIAQLNTTPLTRTMDKFLALLASKLQARENYMFQYEPLTRFFPKYKSSITSTDKLLIVIILLITYLTTLVGSVFGHSAEALISALILGLGYYFGRKFISRK